MRGMGCDSFIVFCIAIKMNDVRFNVIDPYNDMVKRHGGSSLKLTPGLIMNPGKNPSLILLMMK
jgi:hypothetical protein